MEELLRQLLALLLEVYKKQEETNELLEAILESLQSN